jgi:hypothetical protein
MTGYREEILSGTANDRNRLIIPTRSPLLNLLPSARRRLSPCTRIAKTSPYPPGVCAHRVEILSVAANDRNRLIPTRSPLLNLLPRARRRMSPGPGIVSTGPYPPGARSHREDILSGAANDRNRLIPTRSPLLNLLPWARRRPSPGPGIPKTNPYPPGARAHREEIRSGAANHRNRVIPTRSPLLNLLPREQSSLSPGPGITKSSPYPPGAPTRQEEILSGAVIDRNRLRTTRSPLLNLLPSTQRTPSPEPEITITSSYPPSARRRLLPGPEIAG